MNVDLPKLPEATLLIAAITAMLYSLGVAWTASEASVLDLPYDLIRKDQASNLVLGVRGLVEVLLSPVSLIAEHTERFARFITLAATSLFAAYAWFFFSRPRIRLLMLSTALYLGSLCIVYVNVLGKAKEEILHQRACTENDSCYATHEIHLSSDSSDKTKICTGRIVAVGAENVVLVKGVLTHIVPLRNIYEIKIELKAQ